MIRRAKLILLICYWFCSIAQAQSCVDSIIPTTDIHNYKFDDKGIVSHQDHKIMWSRCALGQAWRAGKCTGKPLLTTWDEASALANASKLHSFNDWRLPSIHELSGITELRCQNPAINGKLFPNAPSISFWAANEFVNNKAFAWQVFFGSGENHTAKKSTPAAVRLVRSTKDDDD